MPLLSNFWAGLLSPLLLGFPLLIFMLGSGWDLLPTFSRLAYGFLAGYGFISLLFTALLIAGFSLSPWLIYLLLFVSVIICYHYRNRLLPRPLFPVLPSHSSVALFYLLPLILVVFFVIVNTFLPVLDWDALTLYDFRGRLFAAGFRLESLQSTISDTYSRFDYYYSYPFLTSLAHAWAYLLGATSPMIIYAGFYAAVIFLFLDQSFSQVLFSPQKMLFPLLLSLTPFLFSHASIAYTNLPYGIYLFVAFLMLQQASRLHCSRYFLLSCFMLVSALSTRFADPLYLPILIVALISSWRAQRPIYSLFYLFGVSTFYFVWSRYAVFDPSAFRHLTISSILSSFSVSQFFLVQKQLIPIYIQAIRLPGILSLLVTLALLVKKRMPSLPWLILWFCYFGLILVGGYYFSLKYSFWENIKGSAERLLLSLTPLLYYYSLTLFSKLYDHS